MEQLHMELNQKSWDEIIPDILEKIIVNHCLPAKSIYFRITNSKETTKVKSTKYAICIYEPPYPMSLSRSSEQSNVFNETVVKLVPLKKVNELQLIISNDLYGRLSDLPADVSEIDSKDLFFKKLQIPNSSPNLESVITKLVEENLVIYKSKADSFGCCHRYEACSDVGRCLHDNQLYSKACIYRSHLEAGEIFYGQKRNV